MFTVKTPLNSVCRYRIGATMYLCQLIDVNLDELVGVDLEADCLVAAPLPHIHHRVIP